MENEKASLLKIYHIILITIGVVLNLYLLFATNSSILMVVMVLFRIVAFAASLVYLIKGYKKNAELFYKAYLWFLGLSTIISYTLFISLGIELSLFKSFITVMILVAFIYIIAAKDYGKVKSNIISITLAALNIINVIMIFTASNNNILDPNVLLAIEQLILALTMTLMVWVKYQDKDNRGTL